MQRGKRAMEVKATNTLAHLAHVALSAAQSMTWERARFISNHIHEAYRSESILCVNFPRLIFTTAVYSSYRMPKETQAVSPIL
jgi:hypothetical protein